MTDIQKDVRASVQNSYAAYITKSADDFLLFARGLTIPSASGPIMFEKCMVDFQRKCFADLAPSLHAVRDGVMPPKRRFWIERTKKASKDGDMAVCLLWLLAFPKRPLYLQVGAADRDQAAIIKRRIADLLFHNEWLNKYVEVQNYRVRSLSRINAELDIVAADIAGSHGETPDVLVVNELSHVTKWEFVENLLDNADGVPQGLVIIATNAGYQGTKAHALKDTCKASGWTQHILSRPAPWINQSDLADAKLRSTPSRYRRLWLGEWPSGKGDAFGEEDIDRIFSEELRPLLEAERGWRYVAGLDLGVSHDHAGLFVLGCNVQEQRLQAAWLKGWAPLQKSGEVDLIDVENTCYAMHQAFRLEWLGYDPHQAVLMAQRLRRKGVNCQAVPFVGSNLTAMANTLKEVVSSGKLKSFEDDDGRLRRDLAKLSITEKPYGYKLEAVSDEHGHADVGTALVICLPRAVQILAGRAGIGDDVIADDAGEDMSEAEYDQMPQELKDICEAVDNSLQSSRSSRSRMNGDDD